MDAGAELFAEKGYEATTMTEIASRAGAAIGSLYQFFPSKEALAEALFNRFAERAAAAFARVEELAPGCSARELADLFVDYKLRQRSDRDAAIALSSEVAGIVERRKPLGDALRGRIDDPSQRQSGAGRGRGGGGCGHHEPDHEDDPSARGDGRRARHNSSPKRGNS